MNKIGRDSPKVHPHHVWSQCGHWFLRRSKRCELWQTHRKSSAVLTSQLSWKLLHVFFLFYLSFGRCFFKIGELGGYLLLAFFCSIFSTYINDKFHNLIVCNIKLLMTRKIKNSDKVKKTISNTQSIVLLCLSNFYVFNWQMMFSF